jgi:hypothetical protein
MEQNSLLDSCFILPSVTQFSLKSAQQDVTKVAPAHEEQAQRRLQHDLELSNRSKFTPSYESQADKLSPIPLAISLPSVAAPSQRKSGQFEE